MDLASPWGLGPVFRLILLAVALLAIAGSAEGQAGDRKDEIQPPLPPELQLPSAPALIPEEELEDIDEDIDEDDATVYAVGEDLQADLFEMSVGAADGAKGAAPRGRPAAPPKPPAVLSGRPSTAFWPGACPSC